MVRSALAGLYAFLIAAITSAFIVMAPGSAQSADPQPICTVNVLGANILDVNCTLDGQVIPDSQVSVGAVVGDVLQVEVQSQTVTVPVPGPTVTIRPPQATVTIRPPQATVTETVTQGANPVPTATATTTVRQPQATATVTQTNTPAPVGPIKSPTKPARPTVTATATVTVVPDPEQTVSPTRQDGSESDRVSPEPFFRFDINGDDNSVSAAEAGLGALTVLALIGLMLLALYSGYILGYKDSQRRELNFIRALRDQILIR